MRQSLMPPLLIFDLDGTLIDSRLDLAHTVNATREQMNKPPLPHHLIFSYVGNGAPVLIQRAMGADAPAHEVQAALEFFLAYYRQHALDYTVLYPGVLKCVEHLHEAGLKLAVLTNKPVGIAKTIMDGLDLSGKMFRIYGGNSFGEKKPHPVGIDALREEAGTPREETWMIGDSGVDIQTARNAGVLSCGVTYGFQPETLAEFPPDVLVDRLEDFARRFLPGFA